MDEPAKVVSGVAVSTTLIVPKNRNKSAVVAGVLPAGRASQPAHGCLFRIEVSSESN